MPARLLLRFLAVLAGVVLACAAILYGLPANQQAYLAALNDKQDRLDSLQATGRPKMVLVGGSNVAFGMHSGMLEEAFGLPVANMALHAGLRYEYMINQVTAYPAPGDVYLIFPEYSQMYEPLSTGGPIIYQSLDVFPRGFAYVHHGNPYQWFKFRATATVEILQLKVKTLLGKLAGMSAGTAYKRKVFDAYGDIWTPETKQSRYRSDDKHMARNAGKLPSDDFLRITNAFAEKAEAAGARVLFVYPAIAEAKWDPEVARVTREYLDGRLEHLAIVNEPADYVYPDSLFFDTKYHTTQAGRVRRTAQTIDDLRPFLEGTR